MTDTPGAPPQEAPRKASHKRTILMLVLGGLLLAFGGCALFLGNLEMNGQNDLASAGAIIFIGGVLAFIIGALWAFARWADRRFDKAAAQGPKGKE